MSYLLLLGWTFLSASIVPISSEPYFAWLVYDQQVLLLPLIVATIGNSLGGMTTYLLGRWGRQQSIVKSQLSRWSERAHLLVQRYGAGAMILSWVPILGDLLVGVGGLFNLRFGPVMFWMVLGKFGRYAFLGWVMLN